ncbi:MAG: hypothetical protein QW733_07410 [Desulfurococcaceae archaeon]
MKKWRLKRLWVDKPGTGEWKASPWWSSFFPFLYRSRWFYFGCSVRELPITPYRVRNGVDVVARCCFTAEGWDGWLVKVLGLCAGLVEKLRFSVSSLRYKRDADDLPF